VEREAPVTIPVSDITAREREVIALMADGLSNREISERLYLAPSTVKTPNKSSVGVR